MPAGHRLFFREHPLRVLLIAYEFPPGPSPQSLRWARFARELVGHGVELRVLTVQRDAERVRLPAPSGLVIDRTPPGAVSGLIAHVRARHVVEQTGQPYAPGRANDESAVASSADFNEMSLNWKGRLVRQFDRASGVLAFPDHFGQWAHAARLRLKQLLDAFVPDVVISSHEPATTLELGRVARERGFAWLVDLGDPVLTSYTPHRWRRRAHQVEAWTCRNASQIIVTTPATRDLLVARHDVAFERFSLLPQGYDRSDGPAYAPDKSLPVDPETLELVYTGSFYAFRRPQALVEAVVASSGVRLTVATRTPPHWLMEVAEAHPAKVRLAGFLPHAESLALQQKSDVLVNIANDDRVQTPGKVFEYLGAARPILHIGSSEGIAELLQERRRGVVAPEHPDAVRKVLGRLAEMKIAGSLAEHFDLRLDLFPEFEWKTLGDRLFGIVGELSRERR
nr:glycosyltransferase [Luteimonas sp. 9C]